MKKTYKGFLRLHARGKSFVLSFTPKDMARRVSFNNISDLQGKYVKIEVEQSMPPLKIKRNGE